MTIERVVGTTEEMVDIFVQDATVTTGAGLPNLVISTFSSYYHRTDMTSTSSVTLVSTGTMGTWSSGQFLQVNSTFMRGWYQFCCPNGMFANGSSVALHMYGHPSMAPVVMRYDIARFDNQATSFTVRPVGVSSMAIGVGVTTFNSRVGVSSIDQRVGVSTIGVGVSTSWFSGAGIVTTEAGRLSVDVSSIIGTKVVTTFAGYPAVYLDLGLTNNSSSTVSFPNLTISTTMSSVNAGSVGVSSINVAVSTGWFSGAGIVTTLAGRLSVDVSSIMGTKIVTTFAGYPATYFDLGLTNNSTSTVSFSGLTLSTYPTLDVSTIIGQMSTATILEVSSGVGVSTFNSRVGVSSFGLPVGVSSMAIGVGVTTFDSRVGVSSFGLAVGVSSNPIGVNVTSVTGIAVTGTGTSSNPWGP